MSAPARGGALRAAGFVSAGFAILGLSAWGALALHFRAPLQPAGAWVFPALWLGVGAVALRRAWDRALHGLGLMLLAFAGLLVWWVNIPPRADRIWAPELAVQVAGARDPANPDLVTLTGVRNFDWLTPESGIASWETRSHDLSALETVDLFLSSWGDPRIAHVIVSFGFADGDHVAFSVEIRRERDELYSEIGGFFKEFELILIAADERDVVRLRTNRRGEDVRLYRIAMPPGVARELFLEYLDTANGLAARPRWYNTVTGNCTTIVYKLARRIVPGLPLDARLVFSGLLPGYLEQVGALDPRHPLEELAEMGRIAPRAQAADADPGFSAAIRAGLPPLPR